MPNEASAVLVPVKAFHLAKGRLAGALDETERAALSQRMATTVVRAAGPLPVFVVCDDPVVSAWAETVGAAVLWRPGHGLNGAVADGVAELARNGFATAIVAHGDLPHAQTLTMVTDHPGVTLVPDRRDDGTNVVALPTDAGFTFSYGPGSFARHQLEAARLGLPWRIVREPRLAWDVDSPDDLVEPDWLALRPS
jgi:2-phospho-L-lactate guanylyltransferase